jgi:hypothetical protein
MKLQQLMTIAGISAVSIVAVGYLATTPVFNSLFSKLSLASTMDSTKLSDEQAAMMKTIKQICKVMAEPDITPKTLVRRFGTPTHEYGEYMLRPLDQYFESLQVTEDTDRPKEERSTSLELSPQSMLTIGALKELFGDYKESNVPRLHPNSPEEVIFEASLPETPGHNCKISAEFIPKYEPGENLDSMKVIWIDVYIFKKA